MTSVAGQALRARAKPKRPERKREPLPEFPLMYLPAPEPGAAQRFGHDKFARYAVANPALLP